MVGMRAVQCIYICIYKYIKVVANFPNPQLTARDSQCGDRYIPSRRILVYIVYTTTGGI